MEYSYYKEFLSYCLYILSPFFIAAAGIYVTMVQNTELVSIERDFH